MLDILGYQDMGCPQKWAPCVQNAVDSSPLRANRKPIFLSVPCLWCLKLPLEIVELHPQPREVFHTLLHITGHNPATPTTFASTAPSVIGACKIQSIQQNIHHCLKTAAQAIPSKGWIQSKPFSLPFAYHRSISYEFASRVYWFNQ